jgi:hypothetical protein
LYSSAASHPWKMQKVVSGMKSFFNHGKTISVVNYRIDE